MFGVNVESIDFNLPVDTLTEKPLFAFSCNRNVRENYRGPLLMDGDDEPITLDNISTKVGSKVKGIFDQKSRHGHSQHDATAYGEITLEEDGSRYYLNFDGHSFFDIPITQYLTKDVGVFVVCDPDGNGREPVFSGFSATHELSMDVGSAYMRFSYYKLIDRQILFGGLDSPELKRDGYVGNFSDEINITNVSGSTGKSVRSLELSSPLSACCMGKDAGHHFTGKIYEMVVTDFEIQNDSIDQVFDNWTDYYSLT